MTARDLLQQRYTLPNGDTAWRASPLVNAAKEGKLVLLDGIHRVNLGTLAVLSRQVHSGLLVYKTAFLHLFTRSVQLLVAVTWTFFIQAAT